MSDLGSLSDHEISNAPIYYDGGDLDVYKYLKYFHNHYPLFSSSENLNLDEKGNSEFDTEYNHFMSVIAAFLMYEWDCMKSVARIEKNWYNLTKDDQEVLGNCIHEDINKLRHSIACNQRFLKLMLAPGLCNETNTCCCETGKTHISLNDNQIINYKQDQESNSEMDAPPPYGESMIEKLVLEYHSKEKIEQKDALIVSSELVQSESLLNNVASSLPEAITENYSYCNSPKNESMQDRKLNLLNKEERNNIADTDSALKCKVSKCGNAVSTTLNNLSKAKATLRQFVRDWSEEGKIERSQSYDPLLEALTKHLPILKDKPLPRVLIPGAGLGRLLFEVAKLGYACQGNELSYAMLLASNFVLNYVFEPNSIVLYPYVLSLSNRPKKSDNTRPVIIPDISVSNYIESGHDFSMCAGEFVEIYSKQHECWDAVLTCFFLDTARNILAYIRTIITLLPRGGLWANLGPLLYHYSGMLDITSIELSWEEIKPFIQEYFDIITEEWRHATYTWNPSSMFKIDYKCIYFVAIRNDKILQGISNDFN
ncbi:hypothetical protein ACR3K2_19680 [Cryptosporidium serpentis]